MKKNRLGQSDLWVSEMGLGCMSLGTDTDQGVRLIHQALDHGVNLVDTADLYDYGLNEQIVGRAIKNRRDKVILATKGGNRWTEGEEEWSWDPSKKHIQEAVKNSLRRLQTEYIDLYQLHGGTMADQYEETIEAFEELKQAGLIRSYGISSLRPTVIRRYVNESNIDTVMLPYSILDRRAEEEVLPLLENQQISVLARGPLAKGLLSQSMSKRREQSDFLDYTAAEIDALMIELEGVMTEQSTIAQIALRYSLGHPAVASVISGASNPEQITENMAAINTVVTEEERQMIQTLSKANRYQEHR